MTVKSVTQGFVTAAMCMAYCNIYAQSTPTQIQTNSYSELLAKAHAGDGSAAYTLGKMYESPNIGPPDYKGAAYWYTQASNRGVDDASIEMSMLYFGGFGVPRDETKALNLLESTANRGSLNAMTRLGELMLATNYGGNGYYYGEQWIRKAADGGTADALNDLGELNWKSVTGAAVVTLRYFSQAVERGSCVGRFNIGMMYFHGSYEKGFAQNAKQAERWLTSVQSCPGASPELKQHALDLSIRSSRGNLPPQSRRLDYGLNARRAQGEQFAVKMITGVVLFSGLSMLLNALPDSGGVATSNAEDNLRLLKLDQCNRSISGLSGGNPWACN